MKKSTLALVVMGIVASASVQAAEIYNKDGNKLDVYGKVKAMHYMSDNDSKDGDQRRFPECRHVPLQVRCLLWRKPEWRRRITLGIRRRETGLSGTAG